MKARRMVDSEGGWMKKGKEEVDLLPRHMKKWGTGGSLIQTFRCFLTHLCITHRVPTSSTYSTEEGYTTKLEATLIVSLSICYHVTSGYM